MVMFCSVAHSDSVAHARVLATALRAQHAGARVVVCRIDETVVADEGEPFETVTPEDLRSLDLFGDRRALSARLPPRLLAYALAEGAEVAVYLDARIYVYASLEPVLAVAREHEIALARRVSALPDDGKRPNAADLILAGQISTNFVATARGGEGERFLQWWTRRTEEAATSASWLDLAPQLFPGAAALDDAGCNVSFWNLHERPLERRHDELLAGGRPLRFFDFAGLQPDRPYWSGESATRVRPIDDPILAEMCGEYAERVRAAGWRATPTELVVRGRLGNGLPMDDLVRSLWADAAASGREFGDPSSPLAAELFVGLAARARGTGRGGRRQPLSARRLPHPTRSAPRVPGLGRR